MDNVVNNLTIIQKDEHFHNVAQPVQVLQRLKILGHFHQGYQFTNVVFTDDEFRQRVSTLRSGSYSTHRMLDIIQVPDFGLREGQGIGEAFHGVV